LGCSKEDYLKKGEDPEYHPEQDNRGERRKTDYPKREEKREVRREKEVVKRVKSPPRRRRESNSP